MNRDRTDLTDFVRSTVIPGGPIVVLESTVIAQGLPWPDNLETANRMEQAVRHAGADPATIGVLDGVARVGLGIPEIERLARPITAPPGIVPRNAIEPAQGPIRKANRRDLAAILARRGSAATTVSATIWLARRAGIDPCVMATGGLGGVHRGAGTTFDVSTDLDELAQASGSVVICSGFKSILDLPATLEVLETRGILLVGYRTGELPAFTSIGSGLSIEHRVDDPTEAAEMIRWHRRLETPGAVVLVQPVPEAVAIDRDEMESALDDALREAANLGVVGKGITPFLLDRIRQATSGKSLRANMALLVENARLAGEIAVKLADR
ncbi:pseudouridine-5'-phosphate glycosidase [Aquisphaera insulae]|uniref:pseudouridine-5'-phosphate glycosidase n=1 Tax=Aquisphaera insulae TaxID=2712864 RepID=UPI00202E7A25|nr:pseudouridine-5'-phosphate glycosidase [Aquisphaera insulae]